MNALINMVPLKMLWKEVHLIFFCFILNLNLDNKYVGKQDYDTNAFILLLQRGISKSV